MPGPATLPPLRSKKRPRRIDSPPESPSGSPEPEESAPKKAKLESEPTVMPASTPATDSPPRRWPKGRKFRKDSKEKSVGETTTVLPAIAPVNKKSINAPPSAVAPVPPATVNLRKDKKSDTTPPVTPACEHRPVTPTPTSKARPVTPTRTPRRKRTTSTKSLGSPDDENLPPPPPAPPSTPGRDGRRKSLTLIPAMIQASSPAKAIQSTDGAKVIERGLSRVEAGSASAIEPAPSVQHTGASDASTGIPASASSNTTGTRKVTAKREPSMFVQKRVTKPSKSLNGLMPVRPVAQPGKPYAAIVRETVANNHRGASVPGENFLNSQPGSERTRRTQNSSKARSTTSSAGGSRR